jgi:predicted restriction endonuclease
MKKCELCDVDRGVQSHHIIKRRIGGADTEENLIYLCPNHHWIADFGTEEEKELILNEIKKITGKSGKEIEFDEKKILDIKMELENTRC